MVVGGENGGGYLSTVEVVSLDPEFHPVPDCIKNRNDFPYPIYGASGASLKDGKRVKLLLYALLKR